MGAPWTRGTTVLTPRKEMVLNTGSHLGRWEVMGTGVLAAGRGSAARGSAPWIGCTRPHFPSSFAVR